MYTVKNIQKTLGFSNRYILDIFYLYEKTEPILRTGFNHEHHYSIFQIELLKNRLNKKKRNFNIEIDFKNQEVNVIYQSSINAI